ncbi:MAG: TerB family tellurite resistance protein [Desulfuromonadales bacterium]
MISKILGFLAGSEAGGSSPQGAERIQVATCALLLELAHADSEFQAIEEELVRDLVQKKFSLSDGATEKLLELAQDARAESLDLFQFARQLNEYFSREEKLAVVEVAWRIVYADGVLDRFEDALMRQLTTLLRLSPKEVIAAKLKVLEDVRSSEG